MFIDGFLKTAKDEHAEYEKANKVHSILGKMPKNAKFKAGDRVAYYSDKRGWKEGPWAHHKKFCSVDEEMDKPRDAYEKVLKKQGLKGYDLHRAVEEKFPWHHAGKFKDHAIGIGDLGTVVKVDKSVGLPKYGITWDKHPNCLWSSYDGPDLRGAAEGM